jgi:general secretion pathway protein H
VALAIAVLLFSMAVVGVGALTGSQAKEATGQLAGTIRALSDTAALSGRTCRLVLELPDVRDEDGAVVWRAECAKGAVTASVKRDDELRAASVDAQDRRRGTRRVDDDARFRRLGDDDAPTVQELQAREKARVEDAVKFSEFTSDEVPPFSLPASVRMEVWTQKQRVPVKSGTAYLYFFPQGFTERAQLWVRQGRNVWTVTVAPLTAKTVIVDKDLEVPRP